MTAIHRSALLPFGADKLFELVSDVEAYPQFMEGCVAVSILRREADFIEARLDLARGGIRHSFSTRNRMHRPRQIDLELIEGPFERFRGRWDFVALTDAGCKVSHDLEFALKSALLGAAVAGLFDKVTNNLVDAVSRRATQLYG